MYIQQLEEKIHESKQNQFHAITSKPSPKQFSPSNMPPRTKIAVLNDGHMCRYTNGRCIFCNNKKPSADLNIPLSPSQQQFSNEWLEKRANRMSRIGSNHGTHSMSTSHSTSSTPIIIRKNSEAMESMFTNSIDENPYWKGNLFPPETILSSPPPDVNQLFPMSSNNVPTKHNLPPDRSRMTQNFQQKSSFSTTSSYSRNLSNNR